MKCYLKGTVEDIFPYTAEYEGKKYPGVVVELFDEDWTSPKDRHFQLKFQENVAHQLKLDQEETKKQYLGKVVSIECSVRGSQGSYTLSPNSVKLV